jgi:hypothetical protein
MHGSMDWLFWVVYFKDICLGLGAFLFLIVFLYLGFWYYEKKGGELDR